MVVKSTIWRRANPAKAAAVDRRSRLKTYGLTEADYEDMVEEQDGVCLICSCTEDRLVVDHDHETGKVRGLLCRACNRGIGLLQDNPMILQKAADYLFTRKKV